jgi:hypothetical protein
VFQWTKAANNNTNNSSSSSSSSNSSSNATGITQFSVTVGSNITDNQQYTVRLKYYLGTIYLNVSSLTGTTFSATVATSTSNSDLLSAVLGPSDLTVGEGFVGCLYSGPGVSFRDAALRFENVSWSTCPLQGSVGCSVGK